ncbi:XdhC family protein [Caproicibacter sp.]|uniref:XdhC family protein n=1 Tax=Caproicibacter sp. TaxID=2814884 RepID=UPI0039895D79
MERLFHGIRQRLLQNKDIVLVTVIASSGSTPRGAGARMAVGEEGRFCGTIGGGAVEYSAEQIARGALKKKESMIHSFCLSPNQVADLGMICGGSVTVHFRYISHTDRDFLSLTEAVLSMFSRRETSWLLTDLTEGTGAMGVYGVKSGLFGIGGRTAEEVGQILTARTQKIRMDGREYYAEELVRSGRVYIFGGGHVAQALVPVLSHVGFRCVVADDRPEFSTRELFPDAEEVLLVDFRNLQKDISLTEDDAVCVMTRGHASDTDVQLQVLKTPVRYVGVMGSSRKIEAVSKILREHGIPEERVGEIHTPIGLEIKAETPAEIAVSIAAELILERARSPA